MTPITDTDLSTLEELHAKATPGEWIFCYYGINADFRDGDVRSPSCTPAMIVESASESDGQFIVKACNLAPALVAEVRGLRREFADLREQLAADVEAAYREGWADADSDGAPYTQDTDWRASYAKQRLDGAREGK